MYKMDGAPYQIVHKAQQSLAARPGCRVRQPSPHRPDRVIFDGVTCACSLIVPGSSRTQCSQTPFQGLLSPLGRFPRTQATRRRTRGLG